MAAKNIDVFLSGGNSNTDPYLSLGGIQSTSRLFGQIPVYAVSSIAGITLIDSVNLQSVELTFVFSTTLLSIKVLADPAVAVTVDVSVDGEYVLATPDGSIELTVSILSASLPAVDTTETVTATDIINNLFDAVSSAESQVGDVNYRHVYIKNNKAVTSVIRVFVGAQLNGLDYLEIGFFSLTSGNLDELLLNEHTAPTGVTFAAPAILNDAQDLTLTTGSSIGMYIKRTVLALTDISTPVDTAVLSITEYA